MRPLGPGIHLIPRGGRTAAAAKLICAAPAGTGCSIASQLSKATFRAFRRGPELAGSGEAEHGRGWANVGRPAQASAAVPGPADNYVAVAARLLTLTDHPGLDLIIVFKHVGDGADASPSGLLMEIARFHDRAPNAHQRGPADPGSNWGGNPYLRSYVLPRVRPVLY
jgi:hypothetical protein